MSRGFWPRTLPLTTLSSSCSYTIVVVEKQSSQNSAAVDTSTFVFFYTRYFRTHLHRLLEVLHHDLRLLHPVEQD